MRQAQSAHGIGSSEIRAILGRSYRGATGAREFGARMHICIPCHFSEHYDDDNTRSDPNEEAQGLSYVNEKNFRNKIAGRHETNTKEDGEVMVAFQATSEDGTTVDLTDLTLDQLRVFCRKVGVTYMNKCTKFQCRKALWILAQFQLQRE